MTLPFKRNNENTLRNIYTYISHGRTEGGTEDRERGKGIEVGAGRSKGEQGIYNISHGILYWRKGEKNVGMQRREEKNKQGKIDDTG